MRTEIIAELAQVHDGSLGTLHSYIDALSKTGIDTVKFQMHIAEAESSEFEKFRVNFSYVDKSRYDYWKRMGFSIEQWHEIKAHCEKVNLRFLCSPFSCKAVDWLEDLKIDRYKIASGELSNYLMLNKICRTTKPLLLSSGMSSYSELSQAIQFIKNRNGIVDALFQCTTSYPTPLEKIGLNVLSVMKEKFDLPLGLSDHSGEIYPSIAAVVHGVSYVEFHAVFSKDAFGPDSGSSLTIAQITKLVKGVRQIETMLANEVDKDEDSSYAELKQMFGKSLASAGKLKKGHRIELEDLESKKPGGMGIPAKEFERVIGRMLNRDMDANEFISEKDLT
jgi:N-acetylneuraminate synthase